MNDVAAGGRPAYDNTAATIARNDISAPWLRAAEGVQRRVREGDARATVAERVSARAISSNQVALNGVAPGIGPGEANAIAGIAGNEIAGINRADGIARNALQQHADAIGQRSLAR